MGNLDKHYVRSEELKGGSMIKYATIEGYRNIGEIQIFSHVYQFVENVEENPMCG